MTENESNNQNDSRYSVKSPSRGGARPGAGRPKGSSNKIRIEDLIDSIESRSGMSFTDQVASNYVAAIMREDWARVENYDKALLNKVVADKSEITVEEIGDVVNSKAEAFKEALSVLASTKSKLDRDSEE